MRVFNSGVDWYTTTNVINDEQQSTTLMLKFLGLAGVKDKWSGGGYSGWSDPDTGLKYGSRSRRDGQADEVLIAPGPQSATVVERTWNVGQFRATRIDLQMTVILDKPYPSLAEEMYSEIETRNQFDTSVLGRRKMVLVKSTTGQTLYIGSRRSARKYFRLYDKSYDYGSELGLVWRQEVQYGRKIAEDAARRYVAIKDSPTGIIDLVSAEFFDACKQLLYRRTEGAAEVVLETEKQVVPLQAKLDWLERCVRPTISLMIEHDLREAMLSALGLEPAGAPASGREGPEPEQ